MAAVTLRSRSYSVSTRKLTANGRRFIMKVPTASSRKEAVLRENYEEVRGEFVRHNMTSECYRVAGSGQVALITGRFIYVVQAGRQAIE